MRTQSFSPIYTMHHKISKWKPTFRSTPPMQNIHSCLATHAFVARVRSCVCVQCCHVAFNAFSPLWDLITLNWKRSKLRKYSLKYKRRGRSGARRWIQARHIQYARCEEEKNNNFATVEEYGCVDCICFENATVSMSAPIYLIFNPTTGLWCENHIFAVQNEFPSFQMHHIQHQPPLIWSSRSHFQSALLEKKSDEYKRNKKILVFFSVAFNVFCFCSSMSL